MRQEHHVQPYRANAGAGMGAVRPYPMVYPDQHGTAPARAVKTGAPPNQVPANAPIGVPKDSEISNPETAIDSQVPRRFDGATFPTSA